MCLVNHEARQLTVAIELGQNTPHVIALVQFLRSDVQELGLVSSSSEPCAGLPRALVALIAVEQDNVDSALSEVVNLVYHQCY